MRLLNWQNNKQWQNKLIIYDHSQNVFFNTLEYAWGQQTTRTDLPLPYYLSCSLQNIRSSCQRGFLNHNCIVLYTVIAN